MSHATAHRNGDVDDFCQQLRREQAALPKRSGQRQRRSGLCESEIMTILIHFHQSHYRDFKAYYRQYVCRHLTAEFPAWSAIPAT
ncbi:MAG: hypothetical protein KF716_00940 [Anaerolineae bacterium]|nr:hypothetical protein [Anaerolineae bacterium]